MKHPKSLHPANADELATIALETGAEVPRGALRYPGESDWAELQASLSASPIIAGYPEAASNASKEGS